MALGSLQFRARAGAIPSEVLEDGVALRGEVEWVVQGSPMEVASLVSTVGPTHALPVGEGSALLRFGNSVGRFAVGQLGTLHVRCGKWTEETFNQLLAELTQVALALPYAADQSAALPHDKALVASDAILMHAFLYARQIVQGELPSTMASLLADPHRLFRVERERLELGLVQHADARTVRRLAAGAEPMVRARASHLSLAKALKGHLPTLVDVPRARHTVDTAENRFVLAFLDQLGDVTARVAALAGRKRANAFWLRVAADCKDMQKALCPLRRHGLWEGVGRMNQVPAASSVLQRRRGYREVFRHHLMLRAATRLPTDDRLTELLGMKDVAALYELWCFFVVVSAVERVLGRAPRLVERPRVDEVQVDIPWGLRAQWDGGVTVSYNLSFGPTRPGLLRSVSMQLRPDIVVQVGEEMHVLDAKLRIDRGPADAPETKSFKWDDIAKMHTYRDALPAVRTAFVLYPGDESQSYTVGGGAVGAVPLVPGAGAEALQKHIAGALGA